MSENNESPKMLSGKENNPERLLTSGQPSLLIVVLAIFIINAIVFGAVMGIAMLLLNQHFDGALMLAEIVVAITLVVSVIWVGVKRKSETH